MAEQGGPYAPDGSAVELYALLPPGDEPDLISAAIGEGANILELGCGAGRVTHELIRRGHTVVGVDQSAAMLARVKGARIVLGDITKELEAARLRLRRFLDPKRTWIDARPWSWDREGENRNRCAISH